MLSFLTYLYQYELPRQITGNLASPSSMLYENQRFLLYLLSLEKKFGLNKPMSTTHKDATIERIIVPMVPGNLIYLALM